MWVQFLALTILWSSGQALIDEDKVAVSFRRGLENYLKTGEKSTELQDVLNELQLKHYFRKESADIAELSNVACLACSVALDVVIYAKRNGIPNFLLVIVLENLCVWLGIESEAVCRGTIRTQTDTVFYIIDNNLNLTSTRICATVLEDAGCKDSSRKDWTINIPSKDEGIISRQKGNETANSLKVLQITDIHYDPGYAIGSNAACDEPLCCQAGSVPAKPEDAAGRWGDYRSCDMSWEMVVDSFDQMALRHINLDFIYFTGDIINHKVWDTDITRNKKAMIDTFRQLKTSFGSTIVYPILGNHEPHPVNLFSTDGVSDAKISTQWVFDLAAEEWKAWLGEEVNTTIVKGGYYTVLVKPGFRIVALNSNVCYIFNWWLLHDDVDPYGQLEWLVEILKQAEKQNESVHILSHIPVGDSSCFDNWSREYAKIINRFSDTITAQFNGHTHKDDTVVYFDNANSSIAVNVAYNGGSLTSYSDLNPNYKVYEVDPQTMEVLDYESWTYNVTAANLLGTDERPSWYKLYSFKEAYGVESLSPQNIADLAERMAKEPELTEKYFRYRYRAADTALEKGCDEKCQLDNLCYMVTYQPNDPIHCNMMTNLFSTRNSASSLSTISSLILICVILIKHTIV